MQHCLKSHGVAQFIQYILRIRFFICLVHFLPGSEGIKLFSCSTQLRMKVALLINVKMLTIVGILTFMSGKIAFSAYLSLKKAAFLDIFILMSI